MSDYYGQDELAGGRGDVDSTIQIPGTTEGSGVVGNKNDSGGTVQVSSKYGENREENSKIQDKSPRQGQPVLNLTDDQKEEIIASYVQGAHDHGILAFNSFLIKREYPKAYEAFLQYTEKRADKTLTPDDDMAASALLYSPRILLPDFFDENEIYVNFGRNPNSRKWSYVIHSIGTTVDKITGFDHRVPTEREAYKGAFHILETKLNKS